MVILLLILTISCCTLIFLIGENYGRKRLSHEILRLVRLSQMADVQLFPIIRNNRKKEDSGYSVQP